MRIWLMEAIQTMNEYTFSEIKTGMTASFTRNITEEMEQNFRIICGDENPLHKEDDFARTISGGKFQSHVSFGMLTASFYSTLAGMYLPGRNSLIHSFDELSFMKPVFARDTLTVEGTVTDRLDDLKLIRLNVQIKNQYGEKVSKARMKVLVLK